MQRQHVSRLNVKLDPSRTGRNAENLDSSLRRMIVGQDEAIQQIVNVYQMHLTGLSAPGRPIGNFLFLGPTGSGKTRIVEATAESLVRNRRGVIKVDCAEFQHSHEISKLIGSPPGYLGHRETHPMLSQEVLNQHHTETVQISFLLFDEIEKASDALWNLLLGILDKATLTLGDNRRVDFSRAMIFMTSNLGTSEMTNLVSPTIGFALPPVQEGAGTDAKMNAKMDRAGVGAAYRRFNPEFINRLDKIVVFKPLGSAELERILEIELNLVQQRVFNSAADRSFVFTIADAGKKYLLQEGTNQKYGARHLKRAIERLLVQPMSNLIATGQIKGGDWVRVDHITRDPGMTFTKEAEGLTMPIMARLGDSNETQELLEPAHSLEIPVTAVARVKTAASGRRG